MALTFFVDAEHHRPLRRIEVETDDESIGGHFLHTLHGSRPSDLHCQAMNVSLILYASVAFAAIGTVGATEFAAAGIEKAQSVIADGSAKSKFESLVKYSSQF